MPPPPSPQQKMITKHLCYNLFIFPNMRCARDTILLNEYSNEFSFQMYLTSLHLYQHCVNGFIEQLQSFPQVVG